MQRDDDDSEQNKKEQFNLSNKKKIKHKRKRHFFDSAKQHIQSYEKDQHIKLQFKKALIQHIQVKNQQRQLHLQKAVNQIKKNRQKSRLIKQLSGKKNSSQTSVPTRKSLRKSSKQKQNQKQVQNQNVFQIEYLRTKDNKQEDNIIIINQNDEIKKNFTQVIQIQNSQQQIIQFIDNPKSNPVLRNNICELDQEESQHYSQKIPIKRQEQYFIENYQPNSQVFQSNLDGKKQQKQQFENINEFLNEACKNKSTQLQKLLNNDKKLLKIQQKIDKFIIYNKQVRIRSYVYLDQLVKYINQAQNFFFNKSMFNELKQINPYLYQTQQGLTKQSILIKGKDLSDQTIQTRILKTASFMINLKQNQKEKQLLEDEKSVQNNKNKKIFKNKPKVKVSKKNQPKQQQSSNKIFKQRELRNQDCFILQTFDKIFKKK